MEIMIVNVNGKSDLVTPHLSLIILIGDSIFAFVFAKNDFKMVHFLWRDFRFVFIFHFSILTIESDSIFHGIISPAYANTVFNAINCVTSH